MTRSVWTSLLVPILAVAAGCEQRDPAAYQPFQQEPCDYVLLIMVDVDYVRENSKPFEFIEYAVQRYFQDRVGTKDQIIISQLSGTKRPLLWQGTPHQLKQEFADREALRQALLARGEQGSRINEGIAESLDYLSRTYSVAQGNARTVVLLVSDMIDDQPERGSSDVRMQESLVKYAKSGGAMGFYFVDQLRMSDVEETLKKSGIRLYTLECDIHGRPPLPSFE